MLICHLLQYFRPQHQCQVGAFIWFEIVILVWLVGGLIVGTPMEILSLENWHYVWIFRLLCTTLVALNTLRKVLSFTLKKQELDTQKNSKHEAYLWTDPILMHYDLARHHR